MSINYELAAELKAAGFPQKNDEHEEGFSQTSLYFPSLSELVEACGERFGTLCRFGTQFIALSRAQMNVDWLVTLKEMRQCGTPEEAVARLWLALNPPQIK